MIRRVFVEDKNGHCAGALLNDLKGNLNLKKLESVRVLQRYDIEGLDDEVYGRVKNLIFCEAPVENLYETEFPMDSAETAFAIEYLPGQFDQRADSAEQCVQIVAFKRPKVACARVYVLKGALSESEISAVKLGRQPRSRHENARIARAQNEPGARRPKNRRLYIYAARADSGAAQKNVACDVGRRP